MGVENPVLKMQLRKLTAHLCQVRESLGKCRSVNGMAAPGQVMRC